MGGCHQTNEGQETIKVVIAPVVIKPDVTQQNSLKQAAFSTTFPILCLYAELTKHGQLLPCKIAPLPWVLRILTEPTATAPFSLGNAAQFDHYYHFAPPPWGLKGPASWQEQLEYADAFLQDVTKGAWQEYVQQLGYMVSTQVALFPAVHLDQNMFQNNSSSLQDTAKKYMIWNKIFAAEPVETKPSMSAEQVYNNSAVHCAHINSKHALSRQQRGVLMQALILKPDEILYIKSSPGTGKTTITKDFIASKWVQAIVDNTLPPSIAIFNKATALQKLTILDCLEEGTIWLTKQQRQMLYQQELADVAKAQIIKNFLESCSTEFCQYVITLTHAKELLRERTILLQTALKQGITAACSYHALMKKIDLSYRTHGGLEQRHNTIKEAAEKQEAYLRYLEILQSLCDRLVAPKLSWRKWLELLPPFKQQKVQKLRTFFAKHLPDEDVTDFTALQMQKLLQNLLLKAGKKNHALADILTQIQIDVKQLDLAKITAKQSLPDTIEGSFELSKLIKSLDIHLRYRIFLTAVHYWEAAILQTAEIAQPDGFWQYYAAAPIKMADLIEQPVDWLLVENGESLSPIDGFYCIEGSKHLVVMGDNAAITPSRIPIEVDVNLLRQHSLIETEEDIEDLQYKGLLISTSKFSTFIEQIADYKGEVYLLNKQWDTVTKIVECQNQLTYTDKLQPCKKHQSNFSVEFSYLPVTGCREPSIGSFRNDAEVMAIVSWIKQHEASILAHYPEYSLADAILVCTTFYGQCLAFKEAFHEYNIDINNVELIQTLHNKRVPIVIFSPVYTHEDKGNLCFDEGEAILRNLLQSAKEQVIVFGEAAIFNRNLHTASGKFAKFLFESSGTQLTEVSS